MTGTGQPAFREIRYDVAGGTATMTLHRPDRLNAFTRTMAGELIAAFDLADADDDVRVVLLTGAGRGFCAGADLAGGRTTFAGRGDDAQAGGTIAGSPRDGGGIVSLRIAASRKPVIVAVNGPAVGVGATMTLPADIRIAADTAKFGFVFARRGLVPEAASSWFLPRIVGISQAMEWVATGARRMLWSMLGEPTPWDAHRLDSRAISVLGRGPDVAEGVESFLEKRPPRFSARVTDYLDVVPEWPAPPADLG